MCSAWSDQFRTSTEQEFKVFLHLFFLFFFFSSLAGPYRSTLADRMFTCPTCHCIGLSPTVCQSQQCESRKHAEMAPPKPYHYNFEKHDSESVIYPGLNLASDRWRNQSQRARRKQQRRFVVWLSVAVIVYTGLIICLCGSVCKYGQRDSFQGLECSLEKPVVRTAGSSR